MRKNSFIKFIKKLFSKMGLTIMTALLLCAVGLGTGIGLYLRGNVSGNDNSGKKVVDATDLTTVKIGPAYRSSDSSAYFSLTGGGAISIDTSGGKISNDAAAGEINARYHLMTLTVDGDGGEFIYIDDIGYVYTNATTATVSLSSDHGLNAHIINYLLIQKVDDSGSKTTVLNQGTLDSTTSITPGEETISISTSSDDEDSYYGLKCTCQMYFTLTGEHIKYQYYTRIISHSDIDAGFYGDEIVVENYAYEGITVKYPYYIEDSATLGSDSVTVIVPLTKVTIYDENWISKKVFTTGLSWDDDGCWVTDVSDLDDGYYYIELCNGDSSWVYEDILDTTSPKIIPSGGTTFNYSMQYTNDSVTLTFSDTLCSSTLYYRKGTSGSFSYKYASAGSSNSVTISDDGIYYYYAIDAAKNRTPESGYYGLTIDKTAPTITPSGGITSNSTSTNYANTSVTLMVTDALSSSTLYYGTDTNSLSSEKNTYYGGDSDSVTISTDGTYYYYAVDAAGNRTPSDEETYYTFTIDKTAPTFKNIKDTAGNSLSSGGSTAYGWTIRSSNYSDTLSGVDKFEYSTDGGTTWTTTTSSITVYYYDANKTYKYKCTDKAGNSATYTLTLNSDSWTSDSSRYNISWYNSSNSTFTLTTPAQLAGLAYLVNSGTTFSGKTLNLGANMDMSAYKWVPIGRSSYSFKGTFNGCVYTISGLNTYDKALIDNVGLIGYSYYGTIKNVTVTDSSLVGTNIVGGIIGRNSSEAINNCIFNGSVTGSNYVGGIVGCNYSGTMNLSNITVYGSVNGSGKTGAVGYLYSSTSTINVTNVGVYVTSNSAIPAFAGSASATKTLDSIVVVVNDSKYYSDGDYSSSDWFRDDSINDGVPALRKHFWVSNGISAQSDIKDYLELESNGYTLVS